mmetsp:Transcript_139222/g.313067  ORF Transcript_139222/g.313067 Transcript_139222/m.313067 type:complete len:230 (-) Transcript_139222:161-850(-)
MRCPRLSRRSSAEPSPMGLVRNPRVEKKTIRKTTSGASYTVPQRSRSNPFLDPTLFNLYAAREQVKQLERIDTTKSGCGSVRVKYAEYSVRAALHGPSISPSATWNHNAPEELGGTPVSHPAYKVIRGIGDKQVVQRAVFCKSCVRSTKKKEYNPNTGIAATCQISQKLRIPLEASREKVKNWGTSTTAIKHPPSTGHSFSKTNSATTVPSVTMSNTAREHTKSSSIRF